MKILLTAVLLGLAVQGPSDAQEIYGVRPGMDFEKAEAKLETRARSRSDAGRDQAYSVTFETGLGMITIAALKTAFESRSAARVQWVSLSISAERASPEKVSQTCQRFRKNWNTALGSPRHDNLRHGSSWRWETPTLQARILCIEKTRAQRAEILLLTEPVLLSNRNFNREPDRRAHSHGHAR